MIEFLLGIIIVLLVLVIYLIISRVRVEPKDVELAISNVWRTSGLDEKVGVLTTHAEAIKNDYRSLDQLLRVPTERGALGELALEQILSDQLPPETFGIRKKVSWGKIPDAHIQSTGGIICIDSKFPLDNYRKMMETELAEEKEKHKQRFIKDIKGHLDKVAKDYVHPEMGSAEFAFVYIPAESVYYFLLVEAYNTLQSYISQGVQVVSPLTLSHKIQLIRAGIHAKKLTEQAAKIRNDMLRVANGFEEIDDKWKVLYESHLRNTQNKADEVNQAFRRLKDEFAKVTLLTDD